MNLFRKWWLATKVKEILKGGPEAMEALKSVIAWIVKLKIVPSGWLTIGSGVAGILMGVLCYFGVEIPGVPCPSDPSVLLTASLGLIGLGRRNNS